jgi:hypothetical protein
VCSSSALNLSVTLVCLCSFPSTHLSVCPSVSVFLMCSQCVPNVFSMCLSVHLSLCILSAPPKYRGRLEVREKEREREKDVLTYIHTYMQAYGWTNKDVVYICLTNVYTYVWVGLYKLITVLDMRNGYKGGPSWVPSLVKQNFNLTKFMKSLTA